MLPFCNSPEMGYCCWSIYLAWTWSSPILLVVYGLFLFMYMCTMYVHALCTAPWTNCHAYWFKLGIHLTWSAMSRKWSAKHDCLPVVGILSGGKNSCEIMQQLGHLWDALDHYALTCSSTSPTLPHSRTLLLLTCCRTSPAVWKPPLIHCQSELLLSLSVLSHLHGSTRWLLRTTHDATTISPCGC